MAAPEVAKEGETRAVRVALGGDLSLGRWRDGRYRAIPPPPQWDEIAAQMAAADVRVVNLESGVCTAEEAAASADAVALQQVRLTSDPEALVAWLAAHAVDVAVVANNHALDCGGQGLDRTLEVLAAAGVVAVGARPRGTQAWSTAVLERAGLTVVLSAVSFHPAPVAARGAWAPVWLRWQDAEQLVAHVASLREAHPVAAIIVSIHWGEAYAAAPAPRQQALARRLVGVGADVVFGHGAHTPQASEAWHGATIIYSAGDLHFGGPGGAQVQVVEIPRPSGVATP